MHNESREPSAFPVNPRTVAEDVGHYGHSGAEWLGADGLRYRTNTYGKGMYTLNGARPVPGVADFRLGANPSDWAAEINAALAAHALGGEVTNDA